MAEDMSDWKATSDSEEEDAKKSDLNFKCFSFFLLHMTRSLRNDEANDIIPQPSFEIRLFTSPIFKFVFTVVVAFSLLILVNDYSFYIWINDPGVGSHVMYGHSRCDAIQNNSIVVENE